MRAIIGCAFTLAALSACDQPAPAERAGEWPAYGGDPGSTKYSDIADIDRSNVRQLEPAWEWQTGESAIAATDTTQAARAGNFQVTPLMVNDTLYLPIVYQKPKFYLSIAVLVLLTVILQRPTQAQYRLVLVGITW